MTDDITDLRPHGVFRALAWMSLFLALLALGIYGYTLVP